MTPEEIQPGDQLWLWRPYQDPLLVAVSTLANGLVWVCDVRTIGTVHARVFGVFVDDLSKEYPDG